MRNFQKIGIFWSALLMVQILNYGSSVCAQSGEQFSPHGNPMALVFSDASYTFNKDGNAKAFEITRAYLGYEYFFTEKIYSRITLDVGDPGIGGLQMTAFLKFAYIQFKNDNFSARFGMIPTDAFSLQESVWGYRYIAKTFQDLYKFNPSSDIGVSAEYRPAKFISFDFSVLNGEGFKRIQIDSTFKTTFGVTVRPFNGFSLRAYYDLMSKNYSQSTISLFAGYTLKKFKAGAEYSIQNNNEIKAGHDFSGISLFSSLGIAKKYTVFARYDFLQSETDPNISRPWNWTKDGQILLAGFDYNPVKGVKIAPVVSEYFPYDESLNNSTRLGLYFELRF